MSELEEYIKQEKLKELNKLVVQRYWNGKWNERRIEILDELQTLNVLYHGTSMQMNGIEEYKHVYNSYLAAFHDSHIEIIRLIAEDDLVMSSVKITAINKGELEGLPPSGKKITISVFTVFRIEDGKIAEEWEVIDELGMMTQLGMELQMKETSK